MAEFLIYSHLDGYEPSPVAPPPLRFDSLDQPETVAAPVVEPEFVFTPPAAVVEPAPTEGS